MSALILLLILLPSILGAPTSFCPTSCACSAFGNSIKVRCDSLHFLKKSLLRDQAKLIVALDISNASLTKLNTNFAVFPNLKYLNLGTNKIQHVTSSLLPESLEVLDLSRNSIKYLPHDFGLLPNLKKVNFGSNPIFCDCDSVRVRDELSKLGVDFVDPVKCENPEEYKGKLWQVVKCKPRDSVNLFGEMQGDAPYEGSGAEEPLITSESIENEFIRHKLETQEPSVTEKVELEGSGDDLIPETTENNEETTTEKDDDYNQVTEVIEPIILPVDKGQLNKDFVSPCNFNCSTPPPIETNDTDNLPAPGFFEGINILVNDLGIIDSTKQEPASTTAPTIETTSFVETLASDENLSENVTVVESGLNEKGMNASEELKTPDTESKQSEGSYIFLGVFLAAIVCLVVYVFVKRRSSRRHVPVPAPTAEDKLDDLDEIELLQKPFGGGEKVNGTPEAVPLINGHTEKNDENNVVNENEPKKDDEVQLRKNLDEMSPSAPEATRVTIKAGEIPNSTPKTPVLVMRHKSSDGSIVTTPEIDQREPIADVPVPSTSQRKQLNETYVPTEEQMFEEDYQNLIQQIS
ncbi:hypothetical protein FQA39_LY15481 [Lamprigera yunnana]|nr:hypothetical protein FQA39_LY15481 [Lamprigera yunnana]